MKKICVILLVFVMGMTLTANAQAPYKHSVGATVLSFNGFSYKTFLMDNFALSIDAGFKWTVPNYRGVLLTGEINPNLMYEAPTSANGLYWLVGGGLSIGGWGGPAGGFGKFGVNAIGGIEYKFNIPLTIQADFRPGFGLAFTQGYTAPFFDWGLCFGIRYTL